jgi:formylglycine-generating enzyme required for sulfatase activity
MRLLASNVALFSGCILLMAETEMVLVEGGRLQRSSGLAGQKVATFEIGKHEVTWDEWQEVRDWATSNGYTDLAGVGAGSSGDHPVRNVSWYDVVKWCNAKSEKEGLAVVYFADVAAFRSGEKVPNVDSSANGYRLPTEAEWEWAARGGKETKRYTYSGSNDVNSVAWYHGNSSGAVVDLSQTVRDHARGTWAVGQKGANELGLHDMSGNVFEWCRDASSSKFQIRGGSWLHSADLCTIAFRDAHGPNVRYYDFGFRLARSSGN